MPKKIRADILLVDQNLCESRNEAQKLIMAGLVYRDTQRIDKASETFLEGTFLNIKNKEHPYVSRGGMKLEKALDVGKIDVSNLICLDIGASTGGFTDCLLQRNAKKVYALDVGYNQLNWKLRNHDQVVVMEKVNFRNYDITTFPDPIEFVCIDVSFISLDKILPQVFKLFEYQTQNFDHEFSQRYLVALIKPQFEVGREFIGKKGVVKDEEKKKEAVLRIENLSQELGFEMIQTIPSPILGHEGNEEFLMIVSY